MYNSQYINQYRQHSQHNVLSMSKNISDNKCIVNKENVSKIYDTNMLCTYQIDLSKSYCSDENNSEEEEEDDTIWKNMLYNVQLSQVFLVEDGTSVTSSYILSRIEKLYDLVKDVQFIVNLISENKHGIVFSDNTQEEKDFLLFQTLFSYDYFHLFHKCMIYYYSSLSSEVQLKSSIMELTKELQGNKKTNDKL